MTESIYELDLEPREGYLYARVRAEGITTAMADEYLGKIAEKCAELQVQRLMLVREIPNVMRNADLFLTSQAVVSRFLGIRVAWVNPYPQNDEALEFAAMVANNRGGLFRNFRSEAEAEQWLLVRDARA